MADQDPQVVNEPRPGTGPETSTGNASSQVPGANGAPQQGNDGVLNQPGTAAAPAPAEPAAPEAGANTEPPANTVAEEPWWKKRIDRLTAEKRQLMADLQKVAANPESSEDPSDEGTRLPTAQELEAEVDRRAAQRAEAIAAQKAWDAKCNAVAEKGTAEFQDFTTKVGQLQQVYDPTNQREAIAWNTMIDTAIEIGGEEAHKIIYNLTPERAEGLLRMTPARMAVALTNEAAKIKATEQAAPMTPQARTTADLSKVPAPITPVGGTHTFQDIKPSDVSRADNLSTPDWMIRRDAEVAERRKIRGR